MSTAQIQPYFLTTAATRKFKQTPRGVYTAETMQPLLIYLPGMDGTGQLFGNQTREIGREFEVRCLAIPPLLLMSWDALTVAVIKLIEIEIASCSAKRMVYLCGESFGGCLALKVATYAPELFDRIILVNPAIALSRQPWLGLGGRALTWVPDLMYELSAVAFLPFLAALERYDPKDGLNLLAAMQTVPKATSMWRVSMLQGFELEKLSFDKLFQPVLMIASGADRLLPSVTDARYLLDKLPKAELAILPNSGHACLLEKDVSLYQIMQDRHFLPRSQDHKATRKPIDLSQ